MIPAHQFIDPPIVTAFQPPEDSQGNPLRHRVMGGVAIGNGNEGRRVREWEAVLDAGTTTVGAVGETATWSTPTPGAETIALAFDNNMNPVLAYQVGNTSRLYFYSTLAQAYDTLVVPGTTSCRVITDDGRVFAQVSSDVIFAYTTGTELHWREQRDRYEVAYKAGDTKGKIKRMGMNEGMRMQIEVWSVY